MIQQQNTPFELHRQQSFTYEVQAPNPVFTYVLTRVRVLTAAVNGNIGLLRPPNTQLTVHHSYSEVPATNTVLEVYEHCHHCVDTFYLPVVNWFCTVTLAS